MRVIVGTSGWQYDDWRDALYGTTPKAKWLEAFAERFRAVEVNNTFYRLPSEETFASWRARTPDEFVFAIKASRFITHVRRLRDVGEAVTVLIERASALAGKLGPILYQVPPSLHRDDALLDLFLATLPPYPRATIEFRHDSWFDDAVFAKLRDRDVALCVAHADPASSPALATATWAYFRLHGGPDYTQYTDDESAQIARMVAGVAASADPVFVFFDNDAAGAAVRDAGALSDRLRSAGVVSPESR
ncbi:MAG TPA: DUF72 domain-containing protein [Actinomycetota bacterium]